MQVGGSRYRFLVDTGIGITVVSSAVAARDDVRQTGKSMSGRRRVRAGDPSATRPAVESPTRRPHGRGPSRPGR
ncbi:hypothetical protein [Paractinoplanes hotanensis]|uniref:hypothetical protein n=1 Tax=Paractinoplanes hotanensis TaxID=2906497 RepID=UPI0034DB54E2